MRLLWLFLSLAFVQVLSEEVINYKDVALQIREAIDKSVDDEALKNNLQPIFTELSKNDAVMEAVCGFPALIEKLSVLALGTFFKLLDLGFTIAIIKLFVQLFWYLFGDTIINTALDGVNSVISSASSALTGFLWDTFIGIISGRFLLEIIFGLVLAFAVPLFNLIQLIGYGIAWLIPIDYGAIFSWIGSIFVWMYNNLYIKEIFTGFIFLFDNLFRILWSGVQWFGWGLGWFWDYIQYWGSIGLEAYWGLRDYLLTGQGTIENIEVKVLDQMIQENTGFSINELVNKLVEGADNLNLQEVPLETPEESWSWWWSLWVWAKNFFGAIIGPIVRLLFPAGVATTISTIIETTTEALKTTTMLTTTEIPTTTEIATTTEITTTTTTEPPASYSFWYSLYRTLTFRPL